MQWIEFDLIEVIMMWGVDWWGRKVQAKGVQGMI